MRTLMIAAATFAAVLAMPAAAQDSKQRQRAPATGSPLAQAAMAGQTQPDVLLDVPNLSVEEITLEVDNLQAHIALDARLANLLKLTAGADASIDKVKLSIKGVQAQATLIVRLENVRAIIERTLQTLDNNPQLLSGLLKSVDSTVSTVGGVANNTVGTVGGVANNALGTVGGITTNLLRNGAMLDLARAGLTEVSRTAGANGQIVRQVRDTAGNLTEVVTDSAGRIVSSKRVAR